MQAISQPRSAHDNDERDVDGHPAAGPDSPDDTGGLVDAAEAAEAEAAEAQAVADAARARLQQLRGSRNAGSAVESASGTERAGGDDPEVSGSQRRHRGWRRPRPATMLAIVAIIVSCALLAASGYLFWQHQQAQREQKRRADFAAAAGQAVVTLMSIDSSSAQDDVQRIIDNSTGQFRDDFQRSADEFVGVARQSKAVTKASLKATAVESMTGESAVVLVTAATTMNNSAGADQPPRTWRLSVNVIKDGDRIKMSKVDFVP